MLKIKRIFCPPLLQKTTPRIILPVTHNKAKLIAKNYSPNNLYFIIFIFMAFPKGSGFPLNFTPQKLRKSTAKRVSPSYLWSTPLLARDFLWLLERSIPAQSLTRPPPPLLCLENSLFREEIVYYFKFFFF